MTHTYQHVIKTPVCHRLIANTAHRIAKKVIGKRKRDWSIEAKGTSSLLVSFAAQDDLLRFTRVWRSASGDAPSRGKEAR